MKIKNKKFGFWPTFMMGITATIGSSVLVAFENISFQSGENWIIILIALLLGGILIIPDMMLQTEVATSFPKNGTAYNWIKMMKWNATAFWFGWILVLFVAATSVATACLALGSIIDALFDISKNLGLVKGDYAWPGKLIGVGFMVFLAITQILIKGNSKYSQVFLTCLKFLPIAFIMVLAMVYGTGAGFKSQEIQQASKPIYGATLALLPTVAATTFAYSGLDSITYVAGEIENPRKTIPKSLLFGLIFVVTTYLLLFISIMVIAAPNNWQGAGANVWENAFTAANVPKGLITTFQVLTLLIFLGSLNAFLFYQSRLISAMSESGDLFKIFAKRTNRTDEPYMAILLLMGLSMIFIFWNQVNEVMNYFALALASLKFIMAITVFNLRFKNKDYVPLWKTRTFIFFFVTTILSSLLIIAGTLMRFIAAGQGDLWSLWKALIVIGVLLCGYPIGILKTYLQKKTKKKNVFVLEETKT